MKISDYLSPSEWSEVIRAMGHINELNAGIIALREASGQFNGEDGIEARKRALAAAREINNYLEKHWNSQSSQQPSPTSSGGSSASTEPDRPSAGCGGTSSSSTEWQRVGDTLAAAGTVPKESLEAHFLGGPKAGLIDRFVGPGLARTWCIGFDAAEGWYLRQGISKYFKHTTNPEQVKWEAEMRGIEGFEVPGG